jgi:hypothetical protein
MMTFEDLLAPIEDEFDADEALAEWRWLVPEPATPLLVTAFGDLFLLVRSGAVRFLDTLGGTCDQVAPSADAWKEMLQNPEHVEEWFMPALVILLNEAGEQLSQGQCYSPVQSIATGGALAVDNFKPTDWQVHLAFSGSMHEQVKKLPPGTKITGVK